MASVIILLICLVGFIVAPVASQQDIVNLKQIEDGSPFTITCSAQQVITSAAANFSSIASLQIHILSSGAKDYTLVAQYLTFAPPSVDKEFKGPPQGRNWKFNFNGSNSENSGANNQASMRIVILVPDGKCEDAGMYRCTMVYYSSAGISTTVFSEQNVSSTARTTEPRIVLDPIYEAPQGIYNTSTYDIGANITVTCRFEGPEPLDFKWKRERRPAIGLEIQYDDYQTTNDITTDPPTKVPLTSATCPEYSHKSVLRLTISQEDTDRRYLCVVVSGEEEKASSAAFIQVGSETLGPGGSGTGSGGNTGAASAGNKPENIPLIAGVVAGVVVAIIIVVVIVVVICYRRRSKGGNKNNEDSPDGGHTQQPPPPVLYSRPNKGVNNNSSNRDSKALDDDGRPEPNSRKHDDDASFKKEGRPYRYNPSVGDSAYTQEHKQTNGLSQRNADDVHYASTDVSNEDESVDRLVLPSGRNKSKPKSRNMPPVPRAREDNKQLNYVQLDLAPSKSEGLENAGRRNQNVVEYAEISV